MRRSIYVKNFISTAAIVLLSFAVLGGMFSVWSYRALTGARREAMAGAARETLRYISAQSKYYGYDLAGFEARMALSMLSRASGFDIIIADAEGVVVSCSDDQLLSPHIGKKVSPEATQALLAGREFSSASFSDVYGERRYAVGSLILGEDFSGTYVIGYLFVSMGLSEMGEIWRRFLSNFCLLAGVVLCIAFVTSLLTTKRQAMTINELAQTARRFARGDFAARAAGVEREDELGELALSFNAMADAMERSETRRRELIANVSHELKTPMTVIAGFADGILDGTIPPESEAKYLQVISAETRRLSRLVRSLLDVSRLSAAEGAPADMEVFDIAELIRVTLVGILPKLEAKGMDAQPELPEEPVLVVGEKDSITQVVYNLLDNAVKFAREGSTLRIMLWKQGECAFVSVEDEGETIPESEMPLIFDRFHKTDRSRGENREGVGLGLYIVKTILDRHNEDIFVASKDGVTRFTFTLRRAVAPKTSQPKGVESPKKNAAN
ncbi:MAG: HAMP domain-containing histidine kinase [Oscillospiraceae bacterium]|nr:HAMP domain-containing histidine kinase [Oscillospiraceae bacterium]